MITIFVTFLFSKVSLGNDVDENSSPAKTVFTATFGSLMVALEGFIILTMGNGYLDPFLTLAFGGLISYGSSEVVQRMASALQYQTWQERM